MFSLIPLALAMSMPAPQVSPSLDFEREFDTALGSAGLSVKTARFDETLLGLFRQSEFSTPLFESLFLQPWRVPFYSENIRQDLAVAAERPSETLNVLGRLLGVGSRRSLIGSPIQASLDLAKGRNPLGRVLEEFRKQGLLSGDVPSLSPLPEAVNSAAALVLHTALRAREFRRLAFSGLGDLAPHYAAVAARVDEDDPSAMLAQRRRGKAVELSYLGAGAHDLLLATQEASMLASSVPANVKYDVRFRTALGDVRLCGGSAEKHQGEVFLVIDTGGDDQYLNAPSNASAANGISIVIDVSGDDRYYSDDALANTSVDRWAGRRAPGWKPGPAGALFGYSILFDRAGNDLYRSHRPGIASGRFGVGVILDSEGEDVYDGYQDGLGFGHFGWGLLEDGKGNDRYAGFRQVQGVGQTLGVGLLLDRAGNDQYLANNTLLDFPSPQTRDHNVSMAQGVGNGRRGDVIDGKSQSGGIGILFDMAGDDRYSCGVFGQGTAYWEGIGFLWDAAGTDEYRGVWYVQGTGAHFAIGALEDLAGNDRYAATMNMAQGAGHDFSTGVLIDHGGNDAYQAPNLSLGAGNANGIGIFMDRAGDDKYESSGITLGRAAEAIKGTLRSRALCLGAFLDLGGQDAYPAAATWAKNSSRTANWTDRLPNASESQVGVFWDR
jgi:hypothetical protein